MDVAILETGNGGDIQLIGNDLAMQGSWGNMPYFGLFGGNKGAVTKQRLPNEESNDWWANDLLFQNDTSVQFNSLTEKKLETIALTSAGRVELEETIKEDLLFMKPFADVTVSVTLIAVDKIKILIRIKKPSNLNTRIADQFNEYIFIWDATEKLLGDFSINDFNDDFFV